MGNPLSDPDFAWMVGTAIGAIITTGPAYLAARRGGKHAESTSHAESEHEATRQAMTDALGAVVGSLNGRLDEMHTTIKDMRDWQAEHTTEHAISALTRSSVLEMRKG